MWWGLAAMSWGAAAMRESGLEPALAAIVDLSAAIASRERQRIDASMDLAVRVADHEQVEEALLQSYLFLGFPAAITALGAWRERVPVQEATEEGQGDAEGWTRLGEAVCRKVYCTSYQRLRRNVQRLHPELDRWMVTHGYGAVLGRSQLGLVERELCVVAQLTVAAWEPQLHSHLRGALNVGAEPGAVSAAVAAGLKYVHDEVWAVRVRRLWRRVEGRAR